MTYMVKTVMENLPIDFLMIDYKGKKVRFPVTSDIEIGSSYADLVDYDPELYDTFKSPQGYIKYHLDRGKYIDLEASKVISEEEKNQVLEKLENNIHLYQQMS